MPWLETSRAWQTRNGHIGSVKSYTAENMTIYEINYLSAELFIWYALPQLSLLVSAGGVKYRNCCWLLWKLISADMIGFPHCFPFWSKYINNWNQIMMPKPFYKDFTSHLESGEGNTSVVLLCLLCISLSFVYLYFTLKFLNLNTCKYFKQT